MAKGRKVELTKREMTIWMGCVGVMMGSTQQEDLELKALYAKLVEARQEYDGRASVVLWPSEDA